MFRALCFKSYLLIYLLTFTGLGLYRSTTTMQATVDSVIAAQASDNTITGKEGTTDGGTGVARRIYFLWGLSEGLHRVSTT